MTFVVVVAIGVPLVYAVSKLLKLHSQPIDIAEKRKEATSSLIVFAVVFIIAFAILAVYAYVWVRQNLEEDMIYVLRDVIWTASILVPVVSALKRNRQSLGSIGISRKSLGKNLAFGFIASLLFVAILSLLAPSLDGSYAGFSLPMSLSLISLIIVGVAEELIFRGYIQTRLVAYRGAVVGVAISTLLFALFNFPLGYFCYSGDILAAFLYAIWRFSTGIVLGYMYHRSQNILPSSIFHTLLVWGALLWTLYF